MDDSERGSRPHAPPPLPPGARSSLPSLEASDDLEEWDDELTQVEGTQPDAQVEPVLLVVRRERGTTGKTPPRAPLPAPVRAPQSDAALAYDAVVVPRWNALFGRAILPHVPHDARLQVLDVGCASGHLALDLRHRLGEGARVVAIDTDAALLDLARRRAASESGRSIFFKLEPVEHMSFGDEVFDLVVGNLVLSRPLDEAMALAEVRRVMRPGATALFTRPLMGTFDEVLDMLRELAVKRDDAALGRRIELLAAQHPTPEAWEAQLQARGFVDVTVEVEELRLPFRNARDLFADPMLERIAMPAWRACVEGEGEPLLELAERALETYFAGAPLSLTVEVGLARVTKPS